MKWFVIAIVGFFAVCLIGVIICILNAAEYQEDWDRIDLRESKDEQLSDDL